MNGNEINIYEEEANRISVEQNDDWIKVGTGEVAYVTEKAYKFQGNWYPKSVSKIEGNIMGKYVTLYVRRRFYIVKEIQVHEERERYMMDKIARWEREIEQIRREPDEFSSIPPETEIANLRRKIEQERKYIKENDEYLTRLRGLS